MLGFNHSISFKVLLGLRSGVKTKGIGERASVKGIPGVTRVVVRERSSGGGVRFELGDIEDVRVVWVGVDRSEGSWAGSAHSEGEGFSVVL